MKQEDKFKQSEIGLIPDDWDIAKIGDVSRINQATINKGHSFKKIEYIDIDSVNDGFIEKIQLLNTNEAPNRARRIVKDKDIIISTVRPNLRHFAFIKRPRPNTVVSTGFAVITSLRIDARFLYYYLTTDKFTNFLTAIADSHTSTYPSFNPDIIANAYVPVPSEMEQHVIAHILGTLDDKIELNRRMNEMLEETARVIFKSWFVDFDPVIDNALLAGNPIPSAVAEKAARRRELLSRASAEVSDIGLTKHIAHLFPNHFEDSELGPIPLGWKVGSVDEAFDLTMGQSPPGDTYNEAGEGLPFYQGRADFSFRFPKRRVYCAAPTRYAKAGDTLISVRAPVGDINMASENCAIGRGVAAARHKTGSRSYSYQFMRSLKGVFARFEAEGTVFGSIGKKDFHAIPFVMPPQELIFDFEARLSAIESRIEVNERESCTLATLRDTLLPKLISGVLRVKDANRIILEGP